MPESVPEAYRALVGEALAEFDGARWDEAQALFRRAHELYPNARTLRGIGMAAFEGRSYVEAIHHLSAALGESRRALTEAQSAQVRALIERALHFVDHIVLDGPVPGGRVRVDGQAGAPEPDGTLLVGLGEHVVEVISARGGLLTRTRIEVRGGARHVIATRPLDPIGSRPPFEPGAGPWVSIVGGGTIIAGGGLLTLFGVLDLRAVEDAEAGTRWSSVSGAADRAPVLTSVGAAALTVGGLAVVAGLLWLALGPEMTEHVALGPRGVAWRPAL